VTTTRLLIRTADSIAGLATATDRAILGVLSDRLDVPAARRTRRPAMHGRPWEVSDLKTRASAPMGVRMRRTAESAVSASALPGTGATPASHDEGVARSRFRSFLLLCGMVAVLAVLPAPAVAEDGPGYGGTADEVTVQWRADADHTEGLAVYAVGFRGGSSVVLRVGSAPDRTVHADAAGTLRVLVVSVADLADAKPVAGMVVVPIDAGTADRLAPGVSVQAIGPDPAGGIRTLVGTVPPPPAGNGLHDVAPWVAVVALLAGSGLLTRLAGLGRSRPAARRYQYAARHRAKAGTHASR
jgi:hypothetical protein